jgi:2-oxoisovalerate dehydrogenase E1 component alpha subunit
MAIDSIATRAEGYGMPGVVIDGCDIIAVYEATFEAARRARSGGGPTLIEAMVERYLPHTTDDDDSLYRSREELEEARKRDPLVLLKDQLMGLGVLTEELDKEFNSAARREVNEATDATEAAPYPETDGFYDHVYSSGGAEGGAPSR